MKRRRKKTESAIKDRESQKKKGLGQQEKGKDAISKNEKDRKTK